MNFLRLKRSGLTLLAGMAVLVLMPAALVAQERIAYVAPANNNFDIWSMKTDGTDPKQLTTNAANDGDPSFSPDGGKIAFVSVRDGNQEIYVMNADGTNQKRLTNNTVLDIDPSWSPDGSKIIFVSFRDG